MSESVRTETTETLAERVDKERVTKLGKVAWETPRMEDVSEQVMAQPYIRFT